MNKFIYGFISSFIIFILIGCSGLTSQHDGIFGKSSQKVSKQADRVDAIERKEANNADARLTTIGAWNEGTKYSLDKINDPPKEVIIAKQTTERISALANKPDFNEVKEIKSIVDGLLGEMKDQRDEATKLLSKKDGEIINLNEQLKDLQTEKKSELSKVLKLAEDNAAKADQYKATLNDMDSFFGLGAIKYGLTKMITKLFWIGLILLVLYLILRFAASANPICGAIFSIFEQIISWFINALRMIAPKAAKFSGYVETKVFDGYKKTLTHLIDEIQMIKAKDDDGVKDKYTIDDLMDSLSKSMDSEDKERVEVIKKELRWK